MECPSLIGLELSNSSKEGLAEIKNVVEIGRYLTFSSALGRLGVIFLNSSPLEASYNIYSTDFEAFAKGLAAVPTITRKRIEQIAGHKWRDVSGYSEKKFWRAIYEGGKIKD